MDLRLCCYWCLVSLQGSPAPRVSPTGRWPDSLKGSPGLIFLAARRLAPAQTCRRSSREVSERPDSICKQRLYTSGIQPVSNELPGNSFNRLDGQLEPVFYQIRQSLTLINSSVFRSVLSCAWLKAGLCQL